LTSTGPGPVRVPDGVVHRAFGDELVLLNLRSGQYHGLNSSGRRIFELILERGTADGVAAQVAAEFDTDPGRVTADVDELCRGLAARGLLEIGSGGD
jgi:hypothetical protein